MENEEKVISSQDLERLLSAIKRYTEGSFDAVDLAEFDDPFYGTVFNEMVDKEAQRNNRYLARINDAQLRIGDTSCLKSMFEQIAAQQDAIRMLQDARIDITPDERPMTETNLEFLTMAAQIESSISPCVDELADAINLFENLGIPEQNGWSGEEEDEQIKTLRAIRDIISRSKTRLEGVDRRVDTLSEDAKELFETIDKKTRINSGFLEGVDSLTKSYKNIAAECLETGRHLYRISRDIDNARNDMFRHFSRPTIHDRLRIYMVDHVTLAWRLYNNIVEFESLRLTQVNNYQGCKMGLWIASMDDPQIADSDAFHVLARAHEDLHNSFVKCYEAKQNYDTVLALDCFNNVMDELQVFLNAMEEMHKYLRSIGITDETDVWQFRG